MTAVRKLTTKKPAVQKARATRIKISSEPTWAEMDKIIAGILKRNAKALEKLARL